MTAQKTIHTDVLVIGSGAVGVAASIDAREAGAEVTVLEREATLGGAAAISGGGCCLAGTPLQRESGIQDSPDLAFDDWVRFGEGSADEEWARFYLDQSSDAIFHWAKDREVVWDLVNPQEGNSVPRWHHPVGGGGGLWRTLHSHAKSNGVNDWLTSTAAQELIVEYGRVVGVRARNSVSGETVDFLAKAMVMGTGGFASNLDMVLEYRPDLRRHRILEGSHVGAKGDGHRLVEGVGGILTHMDDIWFYSYAIPDHKDPANRRGLVIRGIPDAVWVNAQGVRFHNEDLNGGASGSKAVMAQEPAQCWAIIDSAMHDAITVSDPYYYQEGISVRDLEKVTELMQTSPNIKRADTLEGLAEQMGVPEAALVESISRFNSHLEEELDSDPDFGRALAGRKKFSRPPFYALNYFPLARKNFGGVKTDLHCQVLDKHYQPISGLYAAGELTGMAGGHINGKAGLEGTMLGPSLFSGRVAGAWAAAYAGFGQGFKT